MVNQQNVLILTGLTPPHCCACPWISNIICMSWFFVFSELWWKV